jgi:formylmethanofuran dehydrogenase subunit E
LTLSTPVPDLPAALERLRPLHDRLCPRQVLGARIGLYGGALLGLTLPQGLADKRLLVFVETDGCFADGVWAATGCTVGHRTLRVVDHGKAAATFVDTASGEAVRVWPDPSARERARAYAPAAADAWHAQRDGYAAIPAVELLLARPVQLAESLAAILSRPGARVVCVACGEEVMNEREVLVDGRPHCRDCAHQPYLRSYLLSRYASSSTVTRSPWALSRPP